MPDKSNFSRVSLTLKILTEQITIYQNNIEPEHNVLLMEAVKEIKSLRSGNYKEKENTFV